MHCYAICGLLVTIRQTGKKETGEAEGSCIIESDVIQFYYRQNFLAKCRTDDVIYCNKVLQVIVKDSGVQCFIVLFCVSLKKVLQLCS
jgi:hypothetical protein